MPFVRRDPVNGASTGYMKCAACGAIPTLFRPLFRSSCDTDWRCGWCREPCKHHTSRARRGSLFVHAVLAVVLLVIALVSWGAR